MSLPLRLPFDSAPERFAYLVVPPPKLPSGVRVSEVFNTYWWFAAERQKIFFRRMRGTLPPWSEDPILAQHKFTNAYRASDRVSQYLIRHVIYSGSQEPTEVFFRTILFKLFNKIQTWELLKKSLSEISWQTFRFDRYDRILTKALDDGERIYSAAYIMPSGGAETRKHRAHLCLLEKMLRENLPERLQECRSMEQGFLLLRSYPMIGDFLAYQFIIDLNYSTLLNFSEMEFVIPGPGARDGMRKCFESLGPFSPPEIIRIMTEVQEEQFERLGICFENLWGRRLQLIDCQNLFCEVDKYARVAHPDVAGVTGRTRIKQKFRMTPSQIEYFYPPKWRLPTI